MVYECPGDTVARTIMVDERFGDTVARTIMVYGLSLIHI